MSADLVCTECLGLAENGRGFTGQLVPQQERGSMNFGRPIVVEVERPPFVVVTHFACAN